MLGDDQRSWDCGLRDDWVDVGSRFSSATPGDLRSIAPCRFRGFRSSTDRRADLLLYLRILDGEILPPLLIVAEIHFQPSPKTAAFLSIRGSLDLAHHRHHE